MTVPGLRVFGYNPECVIWLVNYHPAVNIDHLRGSGVGPM